jgi:Domain of unknown function (DUF6458)
MAFPVSILLIAIGAVLAFAVNRSPNGINIHAVGWILMAVGFVGLLLGLMWWDRWGAGYWTRRRTYAEGGDPYAPRAYGGWGRRRTVVEDVDAPPAGPPGPPGPPDVPPPTP